ncbi:M23 family metallopeptidase [Flavobacterium nitrogenifigens]|uniref:Peptidase family M23 n=1 Tax=Flavobacterium nitrogenifigens TaxID=1617283 RepID=A0A521CLM3_9FLAO|nr:M23 family metallopeptidase [Flavobacterium nitrogenifigens]KAF2328462.1 M23 family metallopeptidase [Flavobacterium nitrogenifigens]SMO60367.1 Peptidase family M23 [Flavobacterium nitrogenifigens]
MKIEELKIGAPHLKLANENNVFKSKNHLNVEDKREIYSAQIGTQDGKQRHYHVDYNKISYFYGKSRGIKAGEKLKITIYEKGKKLFDATNVSVDTSGKITATLKWDTISQKLPNRVVHVVVVDSENKILYEGNKVANGGVHITKTSSLLGLAEYKSAVLVKKSESNDRSKSKLVIFPLLVKPENDENQKWGKIRNWTAKQGVNMTTFNSNRNSGARKHAARDLYTNPLTEVVAIADGIVLEIADFYCQTHQVTVRHTLKDGRDFIIRYGELDPKSINVKVGEEIKQKHILGKTGKLLDYIKKTGKYIPLMKIKDEIVYMLHFEYYSGSLGFDLNKAPLTNGSKPFLRRSDLLDPISILKEGYKNSFETTIGSKEGDSELFDEEDARMALLKIYKEYGEEIAIIVEKMYRLETDHFKSEQYQYCGTGGMEVFGQAPYYGWDSSTFKKHPEYSPIGTWSAMENKGLDGKGGNAQQKDKPKNFVKLPSVLAGMIYKADYINRYDGNYATWYNKTNLEAQEKYRESLKAIVPRIVKTF